MSKIIGNGLIAKSLKKNLTTNKYNFFASGVSNSNEESEEEFDREKKIFKEFVSKIDQEKKLIYFSTYSIFDTSLSDSLYKKHKLYMEKQVRNLKNGLIIRLPNVIGNGGNSNTMFNYFKETILNSQNLTILKNAHRNILDIEDIVCFINNMPDDLPQTVDLIHPVSYNVYDIALMIQKKLNKKISIKKIEGGLNYFVKPSNMVMDVFQKCNVDITENYLGEKIDKYV